MKVSLSLDCCLFNPTTLPPHVTAMPVYISKFIQLIGNDAPLLDLSWAHQSIIQRKRLPLRGDTRYSISLSPESHCDIFSLKTKTGVRFEVGDLVEFVLGPKSSSRGRIRSIYFGGRAKNYQLEIQLLDKRGDFELIDCASSPTVTVDEKSLQGNIVLLNTREFKKLGYLNSNIFRQAKPSNASQF